MGKPPGFLTGLSDNGDFATLANSVITALISAVLCLRAIDYIMWTEGIGPGRSLGSLG